MASGSQDKIITLSYGMSKRPDTNKKAGRGYAGGLPQLVAAPLPRRRLCRGYSGILWVKLRWL